MKRFGPIVVGVCLVAAALGACLGDDQAFAPPDAGPRGEAGVPDVGDMADAPTRRDVGPPDAAAADAGTIPKRVLLNLNGQKTSEVVAFNLETNTVDGRYVYPASFGTTFARGDRPYLLQQQIDVVARLDEREPWKVRSTWNVAEDGGFADPAAVVAVSSTKAYVLRFNKNRIHVIDPSVDADGGLPTKVIDLSVLLQAGDSDGSVEPTSAVFVPSKKRLYVLLGNIDLSRVIPPRFEYLCSSLRSSLIAIDTDTDSLVPLGGSGPGGSIVLAAHNSPLGIDMAYDAVADRLVVLGAGCNELIYRDAGPDSGPDAGPDAGPWIGPLRGRLVEEVKLTSPPVTRTMLDLGTKDFPLSFLFLNPTTAVVGFWGEAFLWDPRTTTLGPRLTSAPDTFAFDGKDALVGVRSVPAGGGTTFEVVRAPFSFATPDAGPRVRLAGNPFALPAGFLNGAEMWPRP